MKRLIQQNFREIFRFCLVGFIAVAIDFVVYFSLLRFTSLSTSTAKASSFVCGAIFSFIGHRKFVFHADGHAPQNQIGPFVFLYASAILINNIANELVLKFVDIKLIGWFVSTCVSTIWNYLGMKFVVFKKEVEIKTD